MTADEYVLHIVHKYALVARPPSATLAANQIYQVIQKWAGKYLLKVSYSGSSAKGTAISGIADVDLFISLSPNTPETLADIYNKLGAYPALKPYNPRLQNVSIGVSVGGHNIDLVPGKKQNGNTSDHSIYRRKAKSWTQTNVDHHIKLIQTSQRLNEIRAIKIWRAQHSIDFPSFYLELTVLAALSGKGIHNVSENVTTVFEYLRDKFEKAAVWDPANTNNKISDDLSVAEKKVISNKADLAIKATNWNQILW